MKPKKPTYRSLQLEVAKLKKINAELAARNRRLANQRNQAEDVLANLDYQLDRLVR